MAQHITFYAEIKVAVMRKIDGGKAALDKPIGINAFIAVINGMIADGSTNIRFNNNCGCRHRARVRQISLINGKTRRTGLCGLINPIVAAQFLAFACQTR
ncbi:MAG: hypothetical protein AAF221_13225 [Pseudomonadota bacterium]